MASSARLSVSPRQDGVWTVSERERDRVAIAYFPTKFGAMKHAVRAARSRPGSRVEVLEPGGGVQLSRDYRQA